MLHVTVAIIAITLSCKEIIHTHKKNIKQKYYVKRVSYIYQEESHITVTKIKAKLK